MDRFLPAFPLHDALVVIVGAGPSAEAKARLFAGSPGRRVWFTLDRAAPPPRDLSAEIEARPGPVDEAMLAAARFVFLAAEDPTLNRRLAAAARRGGALVNVVDRADLSDFQTPAIVDRGQVVAAISTGGAAPVLAVDIRAAVERALRPGVGVLAAVAAELRTRVKAAFATVDERRRFWERTLSGPAADRADKHDVDGTRAALLDALHRSDTSEGRVDLVGAGPGDPELLTLRAARLIREAEVIVHDRLVSKAVLDLARRDAVFVDVGKTKGSHPVPQRRIEEILIEHARAGRRIVRLKGGDPFIFGRGGEELEALRAANIAAHVTPGITAAAACAAAAGAPLTHRDHAQSVTFVSGHTKADGDGLADAALAAPNQTVVVYMGVDTAADVQQRFLAAGRVAETPVAVIENGSSPDERMITGTLGDLAGLVARHGVASPSIMMVGETARFATPSVAVENALRAGAVA